MRFADTICIVTGGSSGIGLATASQLSLEGGKVAILNRTEQDGRHLVEGILKNGGEAFVFKTDISIPEEIKEAVDRVIHKWHKVDVLVNNALFNLDRKIRPVGKAYKELIGEWKEILSRERYSLH